MIGRVFGGYALIKEIGTGGMGKVYLGEHHRLGRRAAVKVLLPALARDEEIAARFFNEARATSLIRHPGIVEIYNCDVLDGQAFIVMELLDGESLEVALARVAQLAAEPGTVASVLGQIAAALAAAHAQGVIHRDLTPGNVFLLAGRGGAGPSIATKILDFGVAKLAAEWLGPGASTRPGAVLGTPAYMSPEQCFGSSTIDARADVYALGCIGFEMLTGRPPYLRPSASELLVAHLREPIPVPSRARPEIPRAFDDLIVRMLAKDPASRPASMQDVVMELAAACRTSVQRLPFIVSPTSRLLAALEKPRGEPELDARPTF
jgi:serine/threonine-protein kinase